MKVCFAIQDMSLGGSSTIVHDIIKNWSSIDDIFLICFFDNYDKRYDDIKFMNNVSVIMLGKIKTVDLKFLKKLRQTIKTIEPDVISSHLTCTFYLKLVGAQKKCKIFHTIHSEPSLDLPLFYRMFLKKDIINKKIMLIGCCEYISKKAEDLYKVNCYTINNGFSIHENFTKKSPDEPIFLFVGRFDKIKNVPKIIQAFDLMQNINSKLFICGYGSEEEEILNYINKSNRKNKISYFGKVQNVESLYKKCDVLCLISDREGLPVTILEAINYGLSFIVTDVGGIKEYVKNNYNGFFVDKDNISDIAHHMDSIIEEETLKQFCKNSISIKDNISSNAMSLKYQKLLTDYGK